MFSRNQLIIIGIVAVLVIGVVVLIVFGIDNSKNDQRSQPVTLTIFGIDDARVIGKLTEEYQKVRPNVKINYQQFEEGGYEKNLVNALAGGTGPDLMMIGSDWVTKHQNKLAPADVAQLSPKTAEELFPKGVMQEYAREGKIYALPLYFDTMVLFYNKETFDAKGIPFPPKTWQEFITLIPTLKETNEVNQITKPAAAIGGTKGTITHMSDLLELLFLQSGNTIMGEQKRSVLANQAGVRGLEFYLQFSNPQNQNYTWNENLGVSIDSFTSGKTAMIFGYAEDRRIIKNKNPFLEFGISAVPQFDLAKPITVARYWGLGVSSQSRNASWAWDFIMHATTNMAISEQYLQATMRPPALRAQIEQYLQNPELKIFASGALTARSWQNPDPAATPAIFSRMVESVLSGKLAVQRALEFAQQELNAL